MTMKTKHARLAAAALLAAGAAGCSDGLTDLNRNPNEPTEVEAQFLFTNATEAAVSRAFGEIVTLNITGLWAQHLAEFRYTEEDRYEIRDATVQTQWTGFYAGPLQDFNEVVTKGRAQERPNYEAMGIIMRSWTFGVVTDLWGDVGYTDALRGREAGAPNTVEYDPQADIYRGLLAELDAASEMLDPAGVKMGAADLIYGGDPAKWEKFANSLRLRLAMRMAAADPQAARQAFLDAMADGVFTSNTDNAVLRYVNNSVNVHPIFSYQRTRDEIGPSATLVDTLLHLADPRLAVYATKNAGGYYKGEPVGSTVDIVLDSISRIGTHFSRADAPAYVMTYAEVLFLQAEAAERGWIQEDPAALYRAAITASMQQLSIGAQAITDYLAQPRVAYAGLPSIGLQKWIALFGNGPEAYAEWRRTGYPVLVAGPDALNDGKIPVRLPYPASEQSLNNANVQAAMARQGGATLNSPVWWDK